MLVGLRDANGNFATDYARQAYMTLLVTLLMTDKGTSPRVEVTGNGNGNVNGNVNGPGLGGRQKQGLPQDALL